MVEEVDVQPTGESIERTMDVIPNILTDPEFAEKVRVHNDWPEGLDQKDVAILFLTGRFQSAVDLLTRRTDTLFDEVGEALHRVEEHEDRLAKWALK